MLNAFWKDIPKKIVSKTFDQFFSFIFNVENDNKIILSKKNYNKVANPLFVNEFDVETNGEINNDLFKSIKIKILILL